MDTERPAHALAELVGSVPVGRSAQWSFDIYQLLIGWGIALYMLAVTIFPPNLRGNEDFESVFANNRKWLLGTFLIFMVLDITQTAVRGQLFEPRIYLP